MDASTTQLPMTAGDRWRDAAKRAGTHSLMIWPPVATAWVIIVGLRRHAMAFDFGHAYLPAAHAVLAGRSPYPPATIAALSPKSAFVYPPLTAFLAAPFTVFSTAVADSIVTFLAIVCVLGVIWLLGVRDWRCFMVVFLWEPTYSAIQTGNVTLLIALGLALLWRYRGRTLITAGITGVLIALKLFLWPLAVWLLATRRFRAAGGAVVAATVFVLAPWAAIGFAGLRGYPHLLNVLSNVEKRDGYTIAALLGRVASWRTAELVGYAIGIAVLGAAARLGSRDERRSFAFAISAVLLLSPIVSMHYFIFLIVVLCLYRRRFGWPWAAPLLFWVAPEVGNGAGWQTAAALVIAASTFALALRSRRPQPAG